MESSEEEEDFPSIESVTPQSKIDTIYQSNTEKDIVEQLTPLVILHFGVKVLTRISQPFDKYVDALIKALPGPSEEDNLTELKEVVPFRAETDSEQLALLGTAFTVAEELLPMVVSRIWRTINENKKAGSGPFENIMPSNTMEIKDWRRHLQHSLDKLRDHFCRQLCLPCPSRHYLENFSG